MIMIHRARKQKGPCRTDRFPDEPLTCSDAAATCLWNSRIRMVGCMTNLDIHVPPFSSACIDYAASTSSPVAADVQVWYVGSGFATSARPAVILT